MLGHRPGGKECRRQVLEQGAHRLAKVDPLGQVEFVITGEEGPETLAHVLRPNCGGYLPKILHEKAIEEILIVGGILFAGGDEASPNANLAVLREFGNPQILSDAFRFSEEVGVRERPAEIKILALEFLAMGIVLTCG